MSNVETKPPENEIMITFESGTNGISFNPYRDGVEMTDMKDIFGKGKVAVMKIMPMRHTPFTMSKDHNYIIDVDKGRGRIQLHLAISALEKNTTVVIPKGVAFSITNTCKTEPLIITCIQLK